MADTEAAGPDPAGFAQLTQPGVDWTGQHWDGVGTPDDRSLGVRVFLPGQVDERALRTGTPVTIGGRPGWYSLNRTDWCYGGARLAFEYSAHTWVVVSLDVRYGVNPTRPPAAAVRMAEHLAGDAADGHLPVPAELPPAGPGAGARREHHPDRPAGPLERLPRPAARGAADRPG
jgi:hypothetical protein